MALRVGFTASAFDLLHAGHILMLKEAKEHCDFLIAGLHVDPSKERKLKNKPLQSLVERQIQLSAVRYVDQIVTYSSELELEQILLSYPINVRIIGEEYKGSEFTGKEICEDIGIEVYYNRRKHSFSSSELRGRLKCPAYRGI